MSGDTRNRGEAEEGPRRGRQGHRRQAGGPRTGAHRHTRRRAPSPRRLSRPGEDADRPVFRLKSRVRIQEDTVHGGPPPRRHNGRLRAQQEHVCLRAEEGADILQHTPRRRDQQGSAADPVGPAGGDAGAPGHHREHDFRVGFTLHRLCDPEPDRVRGNLPSPRGPAGPVHHEGRNRIPVPVRGGGDSGKEDEETE